MSEGEVIVSGGDASESGEVIVQSLPPWMPRDESTGNFKLLDVVGRGLDRLREDIGDANKAVNVQTAESVDQLAELAQLVELPPKTDESLEKYRRRVMGEFLTATTEGTVDDLFSNISTLLQLDKEKLEYSRGTERGSVEVTVPQNAIDSVSLTSSEFSNILEKHTAAGFRADVKSKGTFTYVTEDEYLSDVYSASLGYDGLDSNSEPKDNGGTYAGLLS